jgi:beta-lactamase class C
MKQDAKGRSPRATWRLATLPFLLTLTLGSAAQTAFDSSTAAATPVQALPDAAEPPTIQAATPAPPAAPLPSSVDDDSLDMPLADDFDVRLFEAMAQQLVSDQRVPGLAMAIVHDGRVLSARGYGITDIEAAEPVGPHTVFRLASLSKAFAGTVTGLLVNDGSLRWDSKLVEYMPGFELSEQGAAERLTVADILSHRVGLPRHSYDRRIEAYEHYRTLVHQLDDVPLRCDPGTCYSYQNVAFSLIGDIVFAATGDFYSQQVQRRVLMPLGMNDASLGLDGITSSPSWARPHVRARGGWASVTPQPTYYELAPAAGVNASASDMAQWLVAQTGHRPDVLPLPLLETLHQPLVETPGQLYSSSWRRARLDSAGYALGWRVYNYAGHELVYHAGAVQGYRGMIALLPERDLGIAVLWNGETSAPTGLLPTILDRAIGLPVQHRWLDIDFEDPALYAHLDPSQSDASEGDRSGSSASQATAAPR